MRLSRVNPIKPMTILEHHLVTVDADDRLARNLSVELRLVERAVPKIKERLVGGVHDKNVSFDMPCARRQVSEIAVVNGGLFRIVGRETLLHPMINAKDHSPHALD